MENTKPKKQKKKKIGLKVAILVILAIVALFIGLIEFVTDYLWFKELGYITVFFTKLFTQLKIGTSVFIVITLLSYIYFKYLKINYFRKVHSDEVPNGKVVNRVTWVMAAIFGGIVTYFTVKNLWFDYLKFANSTDFNLKDPLYKNDISFYVMRLDFIEQINTLLIIVLALLIVMTVIYYVMLLGERTPKIFKNSNSSSDYEESAQERADRFWGENKSFLDRIADKLRSKFVDFSDAQGDFEREERKEPKIRKRMDEENIHNLFSIASKQLIITGVVLFLMLGVHFYLSKFNLLHSHNGVVYGAGYADVHVRLLVIKILMILSAIGALTVIIGVKKQKKRWITIVPILMVIVFFAGNGAAALIQNFVVSPDEINKESRYLKRNIEFTQHAYDLDEVTKKSFPANNTLDAKAIKENEATISNIRINDYAPAKKFYNQTQNIRQYYDFHDVDVDRYTVNGEYTQTFLSPREIDESKLSETWLNRHLKYTHGYGITMSRVDKVTSSGQPDMLVGGIPTESSANEIKITRPEVYFGEKTNEYIVVDTKEDEFDYPDGDSNKYTRYEGSAGIKMNLLNRAMFAIRERSIKLLVSSNISSDSKIIINRNIVKRINKIMPYLEYDNDPYMFTSNGKLYWMIDAYTKSNRYPYSEPYDESGMNYIRNSIKVVVDAYNGDVKYYIADKQDPIAKTYQKIYPKLFKDYDQMPTDIKAHIRYPKKMFQRQAKVYRRYHVNDVKVFYLNEDMWDISNEIYGTKETPLEPNYYILNLPGEKKEEFVSSIPYTPKDKKNLTGIFVARNDGENYGKLVLYKLPKSKVTYGPMQVEAQIDQNTEISKEFSLWNSSGSVYSRGNLFVLPINDALLYVEPVYLEATNSPLPEVKRVVVAYKDKIAYEPTLAEALNSLFGEGAGDKYSGNNIKGKDKVKGSKGKSLGQSEIIKKAQNAYNAALKAQKNGDWAEYGKHMNELEKYLKQLK